MAEFIYDLLVAWGLAVMIITGLLYWAYLRAKLRR